MTPEEISTIRQAMPETLSFPYFEDRESAWLLAQHVPKVAAVGALRKEHFGKLLDRPSMRPVVARCGGNLRQRDVLAVAHADKAMRMLGVSAAGEAGVAAAFALPWHDFELTFAPWGLQRSYWDQTTRRHDNLVLQLGFPSDHAELMGTCLRREARKDFEYDAHPIRTTGRPTLAWVRLDVDLSNGEALIEEVQSDWLRYAGYELDSLREHAPRSRELASMERYRTGLVARYDKVWSRAALLAALSVLRDELAIRRVWMHQPQSGAVLKRISGTHPPRSLYSSLPKSFGFSPTRARPTFLRRIPAQTTKRLPKTGPLFWHMEFR